MKPDTGLIPRTMREAFGFQPRLEVEEQWHPASGFLVAASIILLIGWLVMGHSEEPARLKADKCQLIGRATSGEFVYQCRSGLRVSGVALR